MALRRYTKSIDGTIPIPALLYNDEEILGSQDGLGIYDGAQKSGDHQKGTIHVSSHRLFYVDTDHPSSSSFAMDLSFVERTEYYAGLFKSSAKVTLYLANSDIDSRRPAELEDIFESWECEVCSHRNPPGLSPTAAQICDLCGVPRSAVAAPVGHASIPREQNLSSSLPNSALASSLSLSRRSEPDAISCPACTFLNHPSLRSCEMCSTPLPLQSYQPGIRGMKSAPASRSQSILLDNDNDSDPNNHIIKLSFRKSGDKVFYAVLKRVLKTRAWQNNGIGKGSQNGNNPSGASSPNASSDQSAVRRLGIDGILRTVEISAQKTETDLTDAFQDLEAIMVKAKDLVQLAAELNEKLTASSTTTTTQTIAPSVDPFSSPSLTAISSTSQSMFSTTTLVPSTEPEEATFIRSSLSQLGLQMSNAPVTLDMIKDERRWIEELARELATILQGYSHEWNQSGGKPVGLMKDRGVVGLDEVWGGWNRARGVALIPPSTFLQVLVQLPAYTVPPIRSRTFSSGLSVLHTPAYTHASFAARLSSLLVILGPQTTVEIAREENMTIGLADEMILAVEAAGEICRDDASAAIRGGGGGSAGEVKWCVNFFREYTWDGQEYAAD